MVVYTSGQSIGTPQARSPVPILYMMQTAHTVGNGNYIVQIQGDGNSIVTSLPRLELTRRRGLACRIEMDPVTGKPHEIDVIRPFTRSIDMVGRETELGRLARLAAQGDTDLSAGTYRQRRVRQDSLGAGADRGSGVPGLARRIPHAGGPAEAEGSANSEILRVGAGMPRFWRWWTMHRPAPATCTPG